MPAFAPDTKNQAAFHPGCRLSCRLMKIVVAPDSFKECLDASRVASVLSAEIRRLHPSWEVLECPLSDGGEGFARLVTQALGGELVPVTVTGPMGSPVEAFWGKAGEVGVVDAASACGLSLVPPERRNPLLATSRGLGELMVAAFRAGCRRILVGLGGTATCDGGEGLMSAGGIGSLRGHVSLEVLCDVDNPFVGPRGAARVFAPQKGADSAQVEVLEERMVRLAARILAETGVDVAALPGAGAAGGLAGALSAFLGARLLPGIDTVLSVIGFDRMRAGADLVLTGEGSSDLQTLSGKVPYGVLRRAGDIPVVLLSGRIRDREALLSAGFSDVIAITPPGQPLRAALQPENAERNLRAATCRLLSGF